LPTPFLNKKESIQEQSQPTTNPTMYNHHQNLTQPTMPPPTIALKPVIHLYFERFQSWLDYQNLRETFIKYGEVTNQFIAHRKN
jgi:hypothetical protein